MQCAYFEGFVCRNRDAVRRWRLSLQDHVTADLVDLYIVPVPAKQSYQFISA